MPEWSFSIIAESAKEMMTRYHLCNSCLGRQFALLGGGLTNFERGQSIKLYLTLTGSGFVEEKVNEKAIDILKVVAIQGNFQPAIETLKKINITVEESKECYICEGFMEKIEKYKDLVQNQLDQVEYRTFLIGSKIPGGMIDREDGMRGEFNLQFGESMKGELNREIGKRLQATEDQVDFEAPDIVAIVNPVTEEIELKINPLFIYGRYRKLERGISQTRWICWNCEGKGCEECNGTGLRYEHSVEVFIADPILKISGGAEYKFHGAGREDIDAKMLGTGRPFVVEIKEPKKRFLDLEAIEKEVNEKAHGKVEVSELSFSTRGIIRSIKAQSQIKEKTYRMLIELLNDISLETIQQADEALTGVVIQQKTPQRVLHRRADKIRMKKVYEFKTSLIEPKKLEVIVRCQGGCYVKELITGDDGRTQPNLADLLKTQASVLELDVLNVAS